jgi:MFS family permease
MESRGLGANGEEVPPPRRSLVLVLLGLMASVFAGFVDQTIVSTAGPTIISDLGGLSLYAWVFSAFLITATASMPIFGKLSDRYGRKRFFILGSLIFIGGSMLSGISQSIYQLIIFRGIQGLGAGAIVPIVFSLIGVTFPRNLVVKAQGLLFAMVGFATVIGPSIGSYLVQAAGWRWVFYFNLPVGMLSVVSILIGLKESRDSTPKPAIDWAGIVSLLGWSLLLMFGLLDGGSTFAWYSWQEGIAFGGAATLFILFAFFERRAKDPVIPPSLLRIRTVTASLSVALVRQTTFFAAIIYSPLFVQAALGGSVADGRNALYALAIPFVAGSLLSGQAITRGASYRATIFFGVAAMGIGMYSLTYSNSSSSILQLMAAIGPIGFGAGLTIIATLSAIQNSVDRRQIGVATSLLTFMLFLGSSIGLAILGSIQNNAFGSQLSAVLQQLPSQGKIQVSTLLGNPNLVGNLLATPGSLAQGVALHPLLAPLVPQLRNAFALSLIPVFWFAVGLAALGLVSSVMIAGSLKPHTMPQPVGSLESIPSEKTGAV